MSAPLCAVCYRKPRVEGSAKCRECSPGQVAVPEPLRSAPLTRFERAVLRRKVVPIGTSLDPDDDEPCP